MGTGVNDFLAFATGGGALVLSQADYAALPARGTGFQNGIAEPDELNKVWRQSATMAGVIAKFIIAQIPTEDVLDNGDLDAIVAQLTAAIQQAAGAGASPISKVTASADFAASAAIARYAFKRTAGLAPFNVTLSNAMGLGQSQVYQDIVGGTQANPITVIPPAGTINGKANYVMNEDLMTATFTNYGGNDYGVEVS